MSSHIVPDFYSSIRTIKTVGNHKPTQKKAGPLIRSTTGMPVGLRKALEEILGASVVEVQKLTLSPEDKKVAEKLFDDFLEWGALFTELPEEVLTRYIPVSTEIAVRTFQELVAVGGKVTAACPESGDGHMDKHAISNASALMLFGIYLYQKHEEQTKI